MTPEQQAALEALIERVLTAPEITTLDPLVAARNDRAIAEVLSTGRTGDDEGASFTERSVMESWPSGPQDADAFLSKLETHAAGADPTASITARMVRFMRSPDGIRLGAPTTRAIFTGLRQAGVITVTELQQLRDIATRPAPLTVSAVSNALNALGGG